MTEESAACSICGDSFPIDKLESIGEVGDGNVICGYCVDDRECSFKATKCPQYLFGYCTDSKLTQVCPTL